MGANLLIAVPTYETIEPEVFKSIYNLHVPPKVSNVDFDYIRGYDCACARNEIAKKAIEGDYDYVLMVDSDTVIPDYTLASFFEIDPGDLLLGIYPRKDDSHKTELFSFSHSDYTEANRYGFNELRQMLDIHEAYRVKVKGGGFGCAMINVDILRKMPSPWFMYVTYPNGDTLSEDLYFCEQMHKFGAPISADTRVLCGHITKYTKYE